MYSGMAKGTSQAEATLSNQACRLYVESCESEGTAVSQSVENSAK